MFKDCELATHIMLYNTVVASSECVIESLISRIEEHNTNSRPLSDDQLQCEMMVRENGPHPLHPSTTDFLTTSLREHFKGGPDKWNFVKGNWGKDVETSQFKVINRHKNSVPHPKI